jgi:hypothetical protein
MARLLVAYDLVGDDTDAEDYELLIGRPSAALDLDCGSGSRHRDGRQGLGQLYGRNRPPLRRRAGARAAKAAWMNTMCGSERVKEILKAAAPTLGEGTT